MTEIESLYRKEKGVILIEIKLTSVSQFFNTFDPAPFIEKELDSEAEKYIVDTVSDFPAKTPCKILIHLPRDLVGTPEAATIIPALRNHFSYKALVTEQKFRARFRYGRWAMLIGLTFLAIALLARQMVSGVTSHLLGIFFGDALLIIGWVAMWEPVTVMLYELWPIIQRKRTFLKISSMPIEILPSP